MYQSILCLSEFVSIEECSVEEYKAIPLAQLQVRLSADLCHWLLVAFISDEPDIAYGDTIDFTSNTN